MHRGGVMCRAGVALVRIKCQVGRAAMPHVGGCSGVALVLQWCCSGCFARHRAVLLHAVHLGTSRPFESKRERQRSCLPLPISCATPAVPSPIELPWDQPSDSCQEYSDWKERKTYLAPWRKIDSAPLGTQLEAAVPPTTPPLLRAPHSLQHCCTRS